MTLETAGPAQFLDMVDAQKGLVDRRIFSDQRIYELELEHIFARAWNFMAHDSQIPNPGDFFLTFIGEDRVIVVRDKEGGAQVLINSCRHRGNAVCRAEQGHATSFMCTYHGWTYDLKGALVGVPGFKEVYHEDINREEWGLIRARVSTYRGFIFANLDDEAPELEEYLGDVGKLCLDMLAFRGDMRIVDGVQKYTIGCNWKFAADNVWDYYHGAISHASSAMAGYQVSLRRTPLNPAAAQASRQLRGLQSAHFLALGEYGHATAGPANNPAMSALIPGINEWRERPEAREAIGPVIDKVGGHQHIFPNFWISANQISMRMPKGPTSTEIWWFIFEDAKGSSEAKEGAVYRGVHQFGPAGMLEQDDGENWDQSTRGTMGVVTRRYPLNYAMNIGRGEIIENEKELPHIETTSNEHAQLWLYRSWAEWMTAGGWAELKANHSRPVGVV